MGTKLYCPYDLVYIVLMIGPIRIDNILNNNENKRQINKTKTPKAIALKHEQKCTKLCQNNQIYELKLTS